MKRRAFMKAAASAVVTASAAPSALAASSAAAVAPAATVAHPVVHTIRFWHSSSDFVHNPDDLLASFLGVTPEEFRSGDLSAEPSR